MNNEYSAPLTNEDCAITDRVYGKLPFGPCFRLLNFIRQESMDTREEIKDYCNYRVVDQVKEDINRQEVRENMGGHLVEDWEQPNEPDDTSWMTDAPEFNDVITPALQRVVADFVLNNSVPVDGRRIIPLDTWVEASNAMVATHQFLHGDRLRFNTLADQMIEEMLRENIIIEPDPQKWIDWATKSERNADRVARFAQLIDGDETGDFLPSQAAMADWGE